jgi:hypothetical protein
MLREDKRPIASIARHRCAGPQSMLALRGALHVDAGRYERAGGLQCRPPDAVPNPSPIARRRPDALVRRETCRPEDASCCPPRSAEVREPVVADRIARSFHRPPAIPGVCGVVYGADVGLSAPVARDGIPHARNAITGARLRSPAGHRAGLPPEVGVDPLPPIMSSGWSTAEQDRQVGNRL